MVNEILTPKAQSAGITTSAFPAGDKTKLPATNGYEEVTLGATWTIVPNLGDYIAIMMRWKNSTIPSAYWIDIRKADGTTVIATITPTPLTTYQKLIFFIGKVTNLSDFVGMRLFVKSNNALGTATFEDSSFSFAHADQINITDEVGIRRVIENLKFFSCGTSEGTNGYKSSANGQDADFTEIDPTNVIWNDIVWSANSGTTLYSWGGSYIGLE